MGLQSILPPLSVVLLLPAAAFAQQGDWQAAWQATLDAAKREGALVITTSSDPPPRDFLPGLRRSPVS